MRRLLIILLIPLALWAQGGGFTIPVLTQPLTLVQSAYSQDLGIKPQDGTYTLHIFVANRFGPYPGHYEAELDIGTKELCSTYGWGRGHTAMTEIILVCPTSNYITLYDGFGFDPSQNMRMALTENGPDYWGVIFDNGSLTYTP